MRMDSGTGEASTRVLLIAPVGEGVGGILAQTNALVGELEEQALIEFKVIDCTQRYRALDDASVLRRAWGGGWQAVRLAVTCVRVQRTFRPHVVKLCSSASLGLVRDIILVAVARLMGAATEVSFHFGRIPDLARLRGWEWRLLMWVVGMADSAVVLDRKSLGILTSNCPNSHIRQLPNAVDFELIDGIRLRADVAGSRRVRPLVVFVGMGLPSKGVLELVEACTGLAAGSCDLEIVGPVGEAMRSQLLMVASRRDGGRWLKLTGAVSRDEAVAKIAAADLFALPSYTEGFPGSVLEAMACGVAIVATGVGAIPEMLTGNDGEAAGVMVQPRDIPGLRAALEDLLGNPAKRAELGAAARRKAEASYRLADLARRHVEGWRKLAGRV